MFKLTFEEYWFRYKNPQIQKYILTEFVLKKKYLFIDNRGEGIVTASFTKDELEEPHETFCSFIETLRNESTITLTSFI